MTVPSASLVIRNPYPGLRPFEVEEYESFFGRDRQIDELLCRLRDQRFVAVVGPSGSGKSSLVRAGLIQRLRVGHLTTAGSKWRIALFRPGSKPIEALAAELDETLTKAPARVAELRKSTQELLHSTRDGRSPRENLLVVVDQFEEIFRFQQDKLLSDRDAAHFVDLLLATEQDLAPDYRVYIVLTMRTEYLGDCAQFEGLPEALNRSQYLVPRLTRAETREAIEGPAALVHTEIASDLIQTLLVESSEGRDTLPLLQHTLMRLWEKRQLDDTGVWGITSMNYQTLGGMVKGLNDHADALLGSLDPIKQALAKKIFRELTEIGQGRDQRHPMRLSRLAQRTNASQVDVAAVVDHFSKESFLTSPDRGRNDDWETDISHESLIRQWDTLRKWAEEEAQDRDDYLYFWKRFARGGEPLVGTDLSLALKWLGTDHSPEWANRYGGDFAATVAYIERSRTAQVQQERKRYEEERRRKSWIVGMVLLLLLPAYLTLSLWNQKQNSRIKAVQGERGVVFSPDGKRLATVSDDKTVKVWDAYSGQEFLTLKGHSDGVYGVVFSPDGKRLATVSEDKTVKVWNAVSGQELLALKGQSDGVYGVVFSPNGKRLATVNDDRSVKVWDADSGQELLTLKGQSGGVYGVVFSPDGNRLATISDDKTANVWDAVTGQKLLTLR